MSSSSKSTGAAPPSKGGRIVIKRSAAMKQRGLDQQARDELWAAHPTVVADIEAAMPVYWETCRRRKEYYENISSHQENVVFAEEAGAET